MARRDILVGALSGVVAGFGAARAAQHWNREAARDAAPPATAAPAAAPAPKQAAQPKRYPWLRDSVAQQGEDIILHDLFRRLGIKKPSYLDIGTHHPLMHNNTYMLYRAGGRGVLVEPNPRYIPMYKRWRPDDRALNIGIGITDQKEADYYIIRGVSQLNTFSRDQVDELIAKRGEEILEKVIKMPLVNINKVISEHFPGGAPDLISIDVEGLDLPILKTLDFNKHRPKVICAETMLTLSRAQNEELLTFIKAKGYEVRGGTFVNTIFVDSALLK